MPDGRDIQILDLRPSSRVATEAVEEDIPRAMENIKDGSRRMARKAAERAGAYRKSRRK